MQYFVDNLEDLLFGVTINDYDPHFVSARFPETRSKNQYIVSYNKQKYSSIDLARKDSKIFSNDT
jgi:hypothetical protein